MSASGFKPNTVYVTYIASTLDQVWAALTKSDFTTQYFFGHRIEIDPRVGGDFALRTPNGHIHVRGKVMEWDPPRRLSVTWSVEGMQGFAELPECLVTYDLQDMGGSVRLTMTEAHQVGCPRRHPRRRPRRLAVHPVQPEERAGNRQADFGQQADGASEGDDGGGSRRDRQEAVAEGERLA